MQNPCIRKDSVGVIERAHLYARVSEKKPGVTSISALFDKSLIIYFEIGLPGKNGSDRFTHRFQKVGFANVSTGTQAQGFFNPIGF